jgi:hypothetical protein
VGGVRRRGLARPLHAEHPHNLRVCFTSLRRCGAWATP